jgi:hypothetical protein
VTTATEELHAARAERLREHCHGIRPEVPREYMEEALDTLQHIGQGDGPEADAPKLRRLDALLTLATYDLRLMCGEGLDAYRIGTLLRLRRGEYPGEEVLYPEDGDSTADDESSVFWPTWLAESVSEYLERVRSLESRIEDNEAHYELRARADEQNTTFLAAWGALYVVRDVKGTLNEMLSDPRETADHNGDHISTLDGCASRMAAAAFALHELVLEDIGPISTAMEDMALDFQDLADRVDEESAKWRGAGRPELD